MLDFNTESAILHLDKMISRHQIPARFRTDNGPLFNSESFSRFLQHVGTQHRKITQLWPEANGICQRLMRKIKRICSTANVESPGEGGVLPYMGYTGMWGPKG